MKRMTSLLLACATIALAGCEHGNVQLNYAGLERDGNGYALTTRIEDCKKQHAALSGEAATQLCEQLVAADADHAVSLDARIRAATRERSRPCSGGYAHRIGHGRRFYYNPPRDGSCDDYARYWNYGNSLPVYLPQGGDYGAMGTTYDPRLWAQMQGRTTAVVVRDKRTLRVLAAQAERNRQNNNALNRRLEALERAQRGDATTQPPKVPPPEVPASQ